jgi:hypothetical protein
MPWIVRFYIWRPALSNLNAMDWKSSIVILYKGCLNEATFLGSVKYLCWEAIEEVEEELQILLIHAARPPWTHAANIASTNHLIMWFYLFKPFSNWWFVELSLCPRFVIARHTGWLKIRRSLPLQHVYITWSLEFSSRTSFPVFSFLCSQQIWELCAHLVTRDPCPNNFHVICIC